jgi:hypothetical protein
MTMADDEALDAVRVTAQRVQRFVDDVEQDTSGDARYLWRASLDDLRQSIRHARSEGFDTADIQEATGGQVPGRFERAPLPADDAQPLPQPPAAA